MASGRSPLEGLRVYVRSLGCSKNLVDTELMLGAMVEEGMVVTSEAHDADVIIVNTCAFIEAAREEAIEAILELAPERTEGKARVLAVAGCLAQRYSTELYQEIPEVDALVGVHDWPCLVDVLRRCVQGARVIQVSASPRRPSPAKRSRVITTGPHSAYVKVSEGCHNRCHYCAIPLIRGPLVSRDQDEIVAEVRTLVEAGIREVILVAQDLTAYGRDREGLNLEGLLEAITYASPPPWLRLLYCHPAGVSEGLIDLVSSGAVCAYLDLPMQHGSEVMLAKMGRKGDPGRYLDLLGRLRRAVPGIFLRSTFMVGHPGEGEREYQELREFLVEASLDRVGFFQYSPEDGTLSAGFGDTVTAQEKEERLRDITSLQSGIALSRGMARVGDAVSFMVERPGRRPRGRIHGQAPGVDGDACIRKPGSRVLRPGDILEVRIQGAKDADFECVL
jgi:ribosomal protein S12 methylthiotransferase